MHIVCAVGRKIINPKKWHIVTEVLLLQRLFLKFSSGILSIRDLIGLAWIVKSGLYLAEWSQVAGRDEK